MPYVDTIVIGAGQAGLALSHHLTAAGHDHVVLERHEIGARWRRESWDSLRLLTPNWLNVLPGAGPTGPDPDGFATAADFARHLDRYADSFGAPVEDGVEVEAVRRRDGAFEVAHVRRPVAVRPRRRRHRLVRPAVRPRRWPSGSDVDQLTPDRYRRPERPPRRRRAGRRRLGDRHTAGSRAAGAPDGTSPSPSAATPGCRGPTAGMDIYWWLQRIGALDRPIDTMADLGAARREPSLQLIGRPGPSTVDLPALQRAGVAPRRSRSSTPTRGRVRLDTGLPGRIADAERRLDALLARIDAHIAASRARARGPAGRAARRPPPPPRRRRARPPGRGITTVLWATGHRRQLPVAARAGARQRRRDPPLPRRHRGPRPLRARPTVPTPTVVQLHRRRRRRRRVHRRPPVAADGGAPLDPTQEPPHVHHP